MKLSIVDLGPVAAGTTAAESFANSVELARAAERLGYARYWVAEHHGIGHAVANSTPEVLVAHLAAATTSIRVGSGGVLINYASGFRVAEAFRVLHALHPGRIDLGIGRANALGVVDHALRDGASRETGTHGVAAAAMVTWLTHEDRVAEVLAWLDAAFPPGHPFVDVRLLPGVGDGPEVWLLGASISSAVLAGRLGLRYCYASFLDPDGAAMAVQLYRRSFRASALPSAVEEPWAMLAVHVVCADSGDDADRLRASAELFYERRTADGGVGPLLDPDAAVAALGGLPPSSAQVAGRWPARISGAPARVAAMVDQMVAETAADEVVIQDLIARHEDRVRSYELLAGVLDVGRAGRTGGVTTS